MCCKICKILLRLIIDFHGNLLGVYLGIRSSLKNNVFITEP